MKGGMGRIKGRYGAPPRLTGKESACNADEDPIPKSGRSPREGNGNPLQYSGLENLMDREVWQARVHGVKKNQTRIRDYSKNKGQHKEYKVLRTQDGEPEGSTSPPGLWARWKVESLSLMRPGTWDGHRSLCCPAGTSHVVR